MLDEYRTLFESGKVAFRLGDRLRALLRAGKVPERPGVYVISGLKGDESVVLYIGMSGTKRPNGEVSVQGLARRLRGKQGGKSRQQYFSEQLAKGEFEGLIIEWFMTGGDEHQDQVDARTAELDLMTRYVATHCRIPRWNTYC